MAVVLPYLEREPLIKYTDSHNITHINLSLTNKICGEEFALKDSDIVGLVNLELNVINFW